MPEKRKKRKIAMIAGSRGEYGYYRPIIKEIIKNPNLDYGIIATNMHVLDTFGSSIKEIEKDKFKIDSVIYNTFDGYNKITMAKSLAVFMLQLPEILESIKADAVLIGGDRGEQFMAAIVAAHMYIPVAHIQAGEISGNIDGVTRHAIARYAHIHLAANKDAADRILKTGEEEFRVHIVGAPQLDEIVQGKFTEKKELFKKFNLVPDRPVFLLVQHPVTEEFGQAGFQIKHTLDAVNEFNAQVIVVLNNSDAGASEMREVIMRNRTPQMRIYPNMPRENYIGLMRIADVIVGNSSSGLLEAPSFGLPAVNIGNRERGRLRGKNVIDAMYNKDEIVQAIKKAMSKSFKKGLVNCENPYGDGYSARRIVDILEKTPFDEKLLVKRLTY